VIEGPMENAALRRLWGGVLLRGEDDDEERSKWRCRLSTVVAQEMQKGSSQEIGGSWPVRGSSARFARGTAEAAVST
jgi:hypothetical protein